MLSSQYIHKVKSDAHESTMWGWLCERCEEANHVSEGSMGPLTIKEKTFEYFTVCPNCRKRERFTDPIDNLVLRLRVKK